MTINFKILLFVLLVIATGKFTQAQNSNASNKLAPEVVPDEKTWGLATLSVSNMRAKPDDASELVSQATMGTPMKILELQEGWCKVQTTENYTGSMV